MESAAKKKNSLAMGVIGTMIVWASALLFSSAANASSASHVGQKSRAEVSGPFTAKSIEQFDANSINATRYYDALEEVALECTVAPVRAPGTLTAAEAAEIQAIAKKYNTTIDVVGSRAAGNGRNIDTTFPVGKDVPGGPPTRSDIDFRIDTKHPQVEQLISELQQVGGGAGRASLKHGTDHRPTYPPFIRIRPEDCQ